MCKQVWNINHLNTILDAYGEATGTKLLGVNTAYLYVGTLHVR